MRSLLVALLLSAIAFDAVACSCFSQEMREKTARETLALARVAVFGRVVDVDAGGNATLQVVESFKGPLPGAALTVLPATDQCVGKAFSVGETALLLSFHEASTACDKYGQDHFLLDAFRANAAKRD